ncbi:FOLH1 isoform 14 [Pongo abelii]|uniref:FOLH1 isoform 14 n=1 Tax=Pongo abelii TaxID=9601 RepID=A0A2J8S646_PONAB|nr:FOLH1 isoform 14 [Pongo abelii]
MWNLLHEADSAVATARRPRWLCAGALMLAGGFFLLGFLFVTEASLGTV